MIMDESLIRRLHAEGQLIQVRQGYVFYWDGGPGIDIYGIGQDSPFETIDLKKWNLPLHGRLHFMGAIEEFLDSLDAPHGPRYASRWVIMSNLADKKYGVGWQE